MKSTKIIASALAIASLLGTVPAFAAGSSTGTGSSNAGASASTASTASLTVTAPASIPLGQSQDIVIHLATGGNNVDTVVLAGNYTPDIGSISFSIASGSTANIPASFKLLKPTIDTNAGLFSVTLNSLQDAISADTDIIHVTVTPKQSGKFSFALTQNGEQGTQVVLANQSTNILAANGITPATTNIAVLGNNSTVANSVSSAASGALSMVQSAVAPAVSSSGSSSSGSTASGSLDTSTSKTAPKSGPEETFTLLFLMIGVAAFFGYKKVSKA